MVSSYVVFLKKIRKEKIFIDTKKLVNSSKEPNVIIRNPLHLELFYK